MTAREPTSKKEIAEHVAFADRLAAWLRRSGVEETELAVDFADIIYAARRAERTLLRMMDIPPRPAPAADEALTCVGDLGAWLLTEMKWHLEELERGWPALERQLFGDGDGADDDDPLDDELSAPEADG